MIHQSNLETRIHLLVKVATLDGFVVELKAHIDHFLPLLHIFDEQHLGTLHLIMKQKIGLKLLQNSLLHELQGLLVLYR